MIEVENVTKLYGEVKALDGVSFRIGKGEVVGLLGPNGAGKTTMMRILSGYHLPNDGRVLVNNCDIYEDSLGVRRSVGYLPENAPVYDELTAEEYLRFIARSRGIKRDARQECLEETAKVCGIEEVLQRSIGTLSKGFRQRVGIAQAIMHSPEILILDEPTTGLDPNQIKEIRDLLLRLGQEKTVILSTHILAEVEAVCGRVLILNEGKIVAEGAPRDIAGGLKGAPRFRLEIRATKFDRRELEDAEAVEEVLRFKSKGNGVYEVEVATSKSEDSADRLFDWAVAHGFKILSMVPVGMSLEEIFARLTLEREREE